jgi:thiol-disulfide isomerase/thioredoxin
MSILNVDNDNPKLFDLKVDEKPTFIIVKAEWCGHCKKLIPELKKLHDKIKEEKIDANIMKIDETVMPKLESDYLKNVVGYPTIRFLNNGNVKDYDGEHKADAMLDFCMKQLKLDNKISGGRKLRKSRKVRKVRKSRKVRKVRKSRKVRKVRKSRKVRKVRKSRK